MFGQFQRGLNGMFLLNETGKDSSLDSPVGFFKRPFDIFKLGQRIADDVAFEEEFRTVLRREKQLLRRTVDFRFELDVEFFVRTRRRRKCRIPIWMTNATG